MKSMKYILLISLIASISLLRIGRSHASTSPDAFVVEVNPSSFEMNQAVDITIKAVNADGEVVKDYQGDVFIEIAGIVDSTSYTVPSDWLYTFLPQDQGIKLFSKGLIIKKTGTFTVKVSDIINDAINGERTIIVWSIAGSETDTQTISIVSPSAGGTERNSAINVIASANSLPNSPYTLYVNNALASEWLTDANWDINAYITGGTQWSNVLQIKITNATNEVIWQSDSTTFYYAPISDGIYNGIQILPSTKIKQGDKINVTISTSDSVTSALLKLSNGRSAPMDRKNAGVFTKQMTIDTEGTIDVALDLITLWQTTNYTGLATLYVDKSVSIGKIRLYADSIDKTKLNVTRETVGTSPQYKLSYGTSENYLDQYVMVSTNEIIIENLTLGDTYYFQITPMDGLGAALGTASDITQAKIWEEVSCIVKWISVTGQKIGDKYYLVWTAVNNVESYNIYRSDFETSDTANMQKIGSTSWTMYEYPFDTFAKKDTYAYFLIEGVCKDGTKLKIDNAKRVQVWPAENILLIILISLFGYTIYKLYGYAWRN